MIPYRLPLRIGELLSTKRKDIDFTKSPTILTVHRRHDDPEDTRKLKPVAKTLGRALALEEDLSGWVDRLITSSRDRGRFPEARKHPYLVFNEDGAPMTLGGCRDIFMRLGSLHPTLKNVTPHVLRHDWNERFVDAMFAAGHPAGTYEAHQKYANGWGPDSKEPLRYAKRAIMDGTNAYILEMQSRFTRGLAG